MFAGSGGTGQAQGLPLRWPRGALIWGRRVGQLVAQGYIRTHTWRVEGYQGGVAGGVPPHKGGPQARPSKRMQDSVICNFASGWGGDRF